jgi:hypothetical protein
MDRSDRWRGGDHSRKSSLTAFRWLRLCCATFFCGTTPNRRRLCIRRRSLSISLKRLAPGGILRMAASSFAAIFSGFSSAFGIRPRPPVERADLALLGLRSELASPYSNWMMPRGRAPSNFQPGGRRRTDSSTVWSSGIRFLTAATASLWGIEYATQNDLVPSGAVTSTMGIVRRTTRKPPYRNVFKCSAFIISQTRICKIQDEPAGTIFHFNRSRLSV